MTEMFRTDYLLGNFVQTDTIDQMVDSFGEKITRQITNNIYGNALKGSVVVVIGSAIGWKLRNGKFLDRKVIPMTSSPDCQSPEVEVAINARDSSGQTPMHRVVANDDVDAIDWLKAKGADINARDSFGQTPIHIAAFGNFVDAMESLNRQGANINARDSTNDTPMHMAAVGNSMDAMKWLKEHGADINARNFESCTPMHTAAVSNSVGAMEWLKEQGADISARDSHSQTPLHFAATGGAMDAMMWLKTQGVDINARSSTGSTPMFSAMMNNSAEAMEWLGEQGAEINPLGQGKTPMYATAYENSMAAMEWLRAQEAADNNAQASSITATDKNATDMIRSALASEYFRKIEQGEKGSWPDDSWLGDDITKCDVCSRPMQTETYMIDGPTTRNPLQWGNQCIVCAHELCPEIRWGRAQLYKMSPDGEWLLVAGGPPSQSL